MKQTVSKQIATENKKDRRQGKGRVIALSSRIFNLLHNRNTWYVDLRRQTINTTSLDLIFPQCLDSAVVRITSLTVQKCANTDTKIKKDSGVKATITESWKNDEYSF